MRQFTLTFCILTILIVDVVGQSEGKSPFESLRSHNLSNTELIQPFRTIAQNQRSLSDLGVPDYATLLDYQSPSIRSEAPFLQLIIPADKGGEFVLNLQKSEILAEDFVLRRASDPAGSYHEELPEFYWGVIEGMPDAHASISISSDGIEGIIALQDRVLTLARVESHRTMHALYQESLEGVMPFQCGTEAGHVMHHDPSGGTARAANPDNCVRLYLEIAHDIYVDKGGTNGATEYILGLMNEVFALYAVENINMTISEMLIWDVPDPYNDSLSAFRLSLGGSFNGDLAHLISLGGGGVAYVDVLCNSNKSFSVAYSGIYQNYSSVPTYSWSVEVIAHELGHNLGSRHTHNCGWNGNTSIDDCGNVWAVTNGRDDNNNGIIDDLAEAEGSNCFDPDNPVLPTSGTVMSYCHLVQGIGINFNNGFGQQPGNLIRNRVHNASCLSTCDSGDPLSVSISQSNDVSCGATNDGTATASASGGSGTYTYSWSTGQSGAVVTGLAAGNFSVTVSDGQGTATTDVTIADPNSDFYADGDGDGYGDDSNVVRDCSAPVGYVAVGGDCDDSDPAFNPGAAEGCGDPDYNCDGTTVTGGLTFYADLDGDGFGDPNVSVIECEQPDGYVDNNLDCNDGDPNIYPGAPCDDGDACTINDQITDCDCQGDFEDSDGDGVCDAEDICPGGDDNQDADNDGVPDACDDDCVNQEIATARELSANASGQDSFNETFSGTSDVSFTVSGLNTRAGYVERITITATRPDGSESTQILRADEVGSTTNVNFVGEVSSLTVTLDNAGASRPRGRMKASIGPISGCVLGAGLSGTYDVGIVQAELDMHVFPNPARSHIYIKLDRFVEIGQVEMLDQLGRVVRSARVQGQDLISWSVHENESGMYAVRLRVDGQPPVVKQLLIFH